jgi:RNA polymerase sigma factor (TIGR02999 family)
MRQLFPLVYGELRRVAHRQLGAEPAGHTLSTTAVVHEAYLKLAGQPRAQWRDRGQFFAVAAVAMRRILVDYARRHRAARRGGGRQPLALDALDVDTAVAGQPGAEVQVAATERAETLIALDEALERLAGLNERLSRVVECRFFAGLTEEETAAALAVTARTVRRDWVKAKAWLYEELRHDFA